MSVTMTLKRWAYLLMVVLPLLAVVLALCPAVAQAQETNHNNTSADASAERRLLGLGIMLVSLLIGAAALVWVAWQVVVLPASLRQHSVRHRAYGPQGEFFGESSFGGEPWRGGQSGALTVCCDDIEPGGVMDA